MITIRPFRHLGLKLLSVGLAVLLWMAVSGEQTVERGLRVSLELQQFPPGLEIQGEPLSTVDVRVRGASGTLGRLSPGDVVAVMDLRAARVGHRLFHLTPEQVRAPFGVEVVQVTPPTVALMFEKSATRQVPVVPEVDGKPAPGYVVGKTKRTGAFAECRDLERILRAANSGAGNRADPDQIGVFLDGAGLQAGDFGLGPPRFALRGLKKSTAAARQRDKDEGADEIQTNSARHPRTFDEFI